MSTIITKRQFPHYHKYTMDLAGRPLTLEVGKLAELANAAVMVGYGDTRVLCCVTAAPRPRDGIDFFPLSVDFEEKMYAVGRIPGSFNRREGRPGEKGILTSRVIDRPIRPLFPYDFRNDVSVMCTVMAVDHDCSPEIAALIGTSAALAISDIPWNGPVAALKVGLVDGKLVFNPDAEQRKVSDLDVTVVSTGKKVVMIEAGANEVDNDTMYRAIELAHNENQKQIELINRMVAEIGKPKFDYPHANFNQELFDKIVADFMDEAKAAMDTDDKNVREARWNEMIEHWHEKYLEEYPDMDQYLDEFTYKFQKKIVKAWLLEGHRVDGRQKNEIRPLDAEVGVLPRVHGSGLFTRGQTQVLSVCTLDTLSANQKLDTIWEETEKRYMHHYNFPGYSVGEAKPARSPGRREIGHGALAERALLPVIPSVEEFPYAIRVVSEVLSSNGSTSQGSVYGSTVAAPYVSKVLSEVLPYLGIEPEYANGEMITLENLRGSSLDAAKSRLGKLGLSYEIVGSGSSVVNQVPASGSKMSVKNGKVILYTEAEAEKLTAVVPKVIGLTAQAANTLLTDAGFNVKIEGATGSTDSIVVSQSLSVGTVTEKGTVITIDMRHMDATD